MAETLKEFFEKGYSFNEELLQAFENRKIVFFIGAGVSRIMGVPGWSDFSQKLIKKAFSSFQHYNQILKEIPDSKERITIAYEEFKKQNKLDDFYRFFGDAMKPNKEVFNSKENIYEILNKFNALFLTTNADNLFEEVIGSAVCHEDCNVEQLNDAHFRNKNHLFYLHGHFNSTGPYDKLVFTAPEYVNRYNNPAFIEFLQHVFQDDNAILFIGYGLNEFELIDYIMTKAGSKGKKAYLLYGFCENEDILYEAKKAYFEALGIKLIPYNLSINGYDALIEVLKALYKNYRHDTTVPISESIKECTQELNDENYTEILRILRNEDLAKTNEPQITCELKNQNNNEWVKRFFNDGVFSPSQIDKKIKFHAWPILDLFVHWVASDDEEAQNAAITFLNSFSEEQIKQLGSSNSSITPYLVQMVIYLDKKHIKVKYADMVRDLGIKYQYFYFEISRTTKFDRLLTWSKQHLFKLLDAIFYTVDFDEFRNSSSYAIKQFFKQLNQYIKSSDSALVMIEYFAKLIISNSKEENYNLFSRINDIDHIHKNHYEMWSFLIEQLNLYLSMLTESQICSIASSLTTQKENCSKKLGLYIARKFNCNIDLNYKDFEILVSHDLFHEFYLFLKSKFDNKNISVKEAKTLYDKICTTSFGVEEFAKKDSDTYWEKYILSKRLLLLEFLDIEESRNYALKLKTEGIEPYNSTQIASECDYVHSIEWEKEIYFSEEDFKSLPYEQWLDKYIEICNTIDNRFIYSYSKQFTNIVFKQAEENISIILNKLVNAPSDKTKFILYDIRTYLNEIVSKEIIIDVCIALLNEHKLETESDKSIAQTCFTIISDINIQNETYVNKIFSCILPWLELSLNTKDILNSDTDVLTNLINNGDFDKYSVLFNCYIFFKKATGYIFDDEDLSHFLTLLNDESNLVFKYTVCYNYQNLKYIAGEKSKIIFDKIFTAKPFDMTSLAFCILNTNYVFQEISDLVTSEYLIKQQGFPNECKDRVMSDRFYDYIIAACYYNQITLENAKKAFFDYNFIEHLLHHIKIWSEKDNFNVESWIVPCWSYIKNNYPPDKKASFSADILHAIDCIGEANETLLDTFYEAANCIPKGRGFHAEINNVLKFLSIDLDKASNLLKLFLIAKFFVDEKELELIVNEYNSIKNHRRKCIVILNELCEAGIIDTKTKEKFASLLV